MNNNETNITDYLRCLDCAELSSPDRQTVDELSVQVHGMAVGVMERPVERVITHLLEMYAKYFGTRLPSHVLNERAVA